MKIRPARPKASAIRPKATAHQLKARQTKATKPVAKAKTLNQRPRTASHPPLDRARRILADEERLSMAAGGPRHDDRLTSSAKAGHDGLRSELLLHTESSPTLTAGDVDAKWQDAYAVGDEAPGGDNPTPDQNRVDDIGKALGIEYEDGQELQGGEEVVERDRHRWDK